MVVSGRRRVWALGAAASVAALIALPSLAEAHTHQVTRAEAEHTTLRKLIHNSELAASRLHTFATCRVTTHHWAKCRYRYYPQSPGRESAICVGQGTMVKSRRTGRKAITSPPHNIGEGADHQCYAARRSAEGLLSGSHPAAQVKDDNRIVNKVLHLPGRNGYRISVDQSVSHEMIDRYDKQVDVTAKRGRASAFYRRESVVLADKRIRANYGKLGRIEVAFHTKRTFRHPPPRRACTGPETVHKGVWKGEIRFRGEHGYTSVRAVKAKGRVVTAMPLHRCPGPPRPRPRHGTTTLLHAGHFQYPRDLFLTAMKVDPTSGPASVTLSMQQDKIGDPYFVTRENSRPGLSLHAFTFNDKHTRAAIDPPGRPLKGSARYSATTAPDASGFTRGKLTGNLRFFLPGAGFIRVPKSRANLFELTP